MCLAIDFKIFDANRFWKIKQTRNRKQLTFPAD